MTAPIRTCVGCRRRAPQHTLVRYVVADDEVVADLARVLPGRGAWLHDDEKCRQQAARTRALQRQLRVRSDTKVSHFAMSSGE